MLTTLFLGFLGLQGSQSIHIKDQMRLKTASSQATVHTCKTNIEKLKQYRNFDYLSVIREGKEWVDPYAPTYLNVSSSNEFFFWADNTKGSSSQYEFIQQTYWLRAMKTPALNSQSIYGSDLSNNQNDIVQGQLGDCYFLAGLSSLGEKYYRLLQQIETDTINAAGIFTVRVYIRGLPQTVSIDDYLPFILRNGSYLPYFANPGKDGSLWGSLMEKVWAKINGNYEFINSGYQYEPFDLIGGCPTSNYNTNDASTINRSPDKAYSVISVAVSKNYMIGVSCCNRGTDFDAQNLVGGHAYTALGAYTVAGTKLILIRNPWGSQSYNGPWGSTDSINWSVANKLLAPQFSADSGNFYMTADDFIKYFDNTQVGFFVDTYVNNYMDVVMCDVNDQSSQTYTLKFDQNAGQTQIGVHFYNKRIYTSSSACSNSATKALVKIFSPAGVNLLNSSKFKAVQDSNT